MQGIGSRILGGASSSLPEILRRLEELPLACQKFCGARRASSSVPKILRRLEEPPLACQKFCGARRASSSVPEILRRLEEPPLVCQKFCEARRASSSVPEILRRLEELPPAWQKKRSPLEELLLGAYQCVTHRRRLSRQGCRVQCLLLHQPLLQVRNRPYNRPPQLSCSQNPVHNLKFIINSLPLQQISIAFMHHHLHDTIHRINCLAAQRLPFVFVFDYELNHPLVYEFDQIPAQLLFNFNGFGNIQTRAAYFEGFSFDKQPVDFAVYKRAFDLVQQHLHRGNSYVVNLTFPSQIDSNLKLDELFFAATAKYCLLLKQRFAVFSPETFITIKDGVIETCPMKGTIDAALPNAEQQILNNPKEAAEHATVVDLLRNDLSRVATQVEVVRYRYVDRLKTSSGDLLQVSSQIRGTLPPDYLEHLGDILFSLLPAGSICGAPKPKTLEIIAEAEKDARGYYTGVMGYFDGSQLDSAVMIRFIEQQTDGSLWFRSGGGITAQSSLHEEYNELIKKIYVPLG